VILNSAECGVILPKSFDRFYSTTLEPWLGLCADIFKMCPNGGIEATLFYVM
jgi:hypothetical protein